MKKWLLIAVASAIVVGAATVVVLKKTPKGRGTK